MKAYFWTTTLLLAALVLPGTTWGAPQKSSRPKVQSLEIQNTDRPLQVPLPKSGISTEVDFSESAYERRSAVEASVSNWGPSLSLPARLPITEKFRERTFGQFGLGVYTAPWLLGGSGYLAIHVELGYRRNVRTGVFKQTAALAIPYTQSLHLVSASIGPEYRPLTWALGRLDFSPTLGLALLPLTAFMAESPVSDEYAQFGLGGMGSVGMLLTFNRFSFHWAALQSFGRLDTQSISAFGVRTGLRYAW